MPVFAWVLADGRAVSTNFLDVEPNWAAIDWLRGATNYPDVTRRAIDEATGHALVTEYAGAARMLRHLLTHTSSIWDDWDVLDATFVEGDSDRPLGIFLGRYLRDEWHYWNEAPGTEYDYSNVGVALAAYAVEAVTGEPFDESTSTNIFKPLGMTETSWTLADLDVSHVAVPYDTDGRPLSHYGYPGYPSASLRTSAPQLARLLAAYAQGGEVDGVRILQDASVAEIEREHLPAAAPEQGLLWYWEDDGYGPMICHAGWDWGVASLMSLRPDDGVGTILLTNGNWESASDTLYVMQERLVREAERRF